MDYQVLLCNAYFPWTRIELNNVICWIKGTLFYKNKLIDKADIMQYLSPIIQNSVIDYKALESVLLEFNGNFSIVMGTPRYIFCTVDRLRSFPLFYALDEDEAFFSDDANHLRDRLDPPLNEENCAEFLATGFVTGSDTLFDGISQLQAGEYLIYDKRDGALTTHFYHRFWHGNYFSDSEEELLDRLDEIFVRVFERLIESTKGCKIVVPLSGGLDSRIIVAMLKRLGVKDVICFTYGKKGNREAEVSRQVAEALGYQWFFVEYTHQKWYDCYRSEDMSKFFQYAGNLVSIPHIQDFLAIKELKEAGKIPENAVIVPGHNGWLFNTYIINSTYNTQIKNNTHDVLLKIILQQHYSLWEWDKKALKPVFTNRIWNSIGMMDIADKESCINAIDFFNFKERGYKFILNSVRVYEFFGYLWRVPLIDNELIKFFLSTPESLRKKKSLYKKYAIEKLFINELGILSEIYCNTDLRNTNNNPQFSVKDLLVSNQIVRVLGRKFLHKKRCYTEYNDHPLAWYGIMSKDTFKKIYTGKENINSFIASFYINEFCPVLLKDVIQKYFKDESRVLSEL